MIGMELNRDRSEKVKYTFVGYPIYARRGLLSRYPDGKAPAHRHDDIEFIAVISGKMNYNVSGETIELDAGDGIMVNSKRLHFGYMRDNAECDFICLLLHPILLCALPSTEREFVQPVLKNESAPYLKLSRDVATHKEIIELTKRIYEVKDQKTAPLLIQSFFSRIWANVCECITPCKQTTIDLDGASVKKMLDFIMTEFRHEVRLADIAKAGNVGESKCCKLFSKYTGQTPNAYLNRVRLDESTHYLVNTDMTITEIAREVGFNGASYYAESFRKQYKQSPSAYRLYINPDWK